MMIVIIIAIIFQSYIYIYIASHQLIGSFIPLPPLRVLSGAKIRPHSVCCRVLFSCLRPASR